MHKDTYENWLKIKESFEESGNTDNFYYQRACTIVNGGKDPLEHVVNSEKDLKDEE